MPGTDIVITTRNRLPYLKKTLEFIFQRTKTSYAIHVIDDASDGGNVKYLLDLWRKGKIRSLLLRKDRCGLRAGLNVGCWLSFSDPAIFTDDDALCPDLNPDWLAQGLKAMKKHPKIGVLALNNPGRHMLAARGKRGKGRGKRVGEVTFCRRVGGQFIFTRRAIFEGWNMSHVQGEGVPIPHPKLGKRLPATERCLRAEKLGYKVAYLTNVYCFHFGSKPARRDKKHQEILEPVDMKTLAPPEKWAW